MAAYWHAYSQSPSLTLTLDAPSILRWLGCLVGVGLALVVLVHLCSIRKASLNAGAAKDALFQHSTGVTVLVRPLHPHLGPNESLLMRPTWWASVPGMCFRILSLVVSAGVSTLLTVAAPAPPAPAPVPAPPMPVPAPVPAAEPIPVSDPARAPAPPPVVTPVPAQEPNKFSCDAGQQPQNPC